MAHDEHLANRVRERVGVEPGLTEKRMFGGLGFLLDGNLALSVSSRGGLLVRCDPEQTEQLAGEPHTDPFVMRGRPMDGWLRVAPEGVANARSLERWVGCGVGYARTLPPKR